MDKILRPEETPAVSGNAISATIASEAAGAASCPSCGGAQSRNQTIPPACVYVIGNIQPRYPSLAIEKEFRQAIARAGVSKDTDRETMGKLLHDPNSKYLVRQLCWVLSVQGIETYILSPRDGDYQPLVNAYRVEPSPGDLELVIGIRGPVAPPSMCNGLPLPILIFDQIYAFDRKSLLDSIPRPKDVPPARFAAAAGEMFDLIVGQSDNTGSTDGDRARNYMAVRYERTYSLAAEQFANNASLTSINVRPSPLNGTRKVVDVVVVFTDRATDVESKFLARVDVTECFPFLVTKMSPYYDH